MFLSIENRLCLSITAYKYMSVCGCVCVRILTCQESVRERMGEKKQGVCVCVCVCVCVGSWCTLSQLPTSQPGTDQYLTVIVFFLQSFSHLCQYHVHFFKTLHTVCFTNTHLSTSVNYRKCSHLAILLCHSKYNGLKRETTWSIETYIYYVLPCPLFLHRSV